MPANGLKIEKTNKQPTEQTQLIEV